MSRIYLHSFDTPYGIMRTAALDERLAYIALPNQSEISLKRMVARVFPSAALDTGGRINREAERQIVAYCKGKLTKFDLDLEWYGTPFQREVLRQIYAIPYGRTRSYGQIAQAIGSRGAARAVGTVNAQNRLPLVIPCHRVVATNGLGGYGGGLDMKRSLLIMEGALESNTLNLL